MPFLVLTGLGTGVVSPVLPAVAIASVAAGVGQKQDHTWTRPERSQEGG
ncbi:hypothetical protein [Microtetraspora fusca]|nr:hypothetical protein [Microtetraspora fusca]